MKISIYGILKRDFGIDDRDLANKCFDRIVKNNEDSDEFIATSTIYESIDEVLEEEGIE